MPSGPGAADRVTAQDPRLQIFRFARAVLRAAGVRDLDGGKAVSVQVERMERPSSPLLKALPGASRANGLPLVAEHC